MYYAMINHHDKYLLKKKNHHHDNYNDSISSIKLYILDRERSYLLCHMDEL